LEEKDVISSAATILSDLCGPQEWISMNNLHEVVRFFIFIYLFIFAHAVSTETVICCFLCLNKIMDAVSPFTFIP
jgi:hypothetical protein